MPRNSIGFEVGGSLSDIISNAGALCQIVGCPAFFVGAITLHWPLTIGGAILFVAGRLMVKATWGMNKRMHDREMRSQ